MHHGRFTIARLLGAIMLFGIFFAGLSSGSNDWFKLIYTLTFITLVYAAIAARLMVYNAAYSCVLFHCYSRAGTAVQYRQGTRRV